MRTLIFKTTVDDNGKADLPLMPDLKGKEVEIIVKAKRDSTQYSKGKVLASIEKWTGYFVYD